MQNPNQLHKPLLLENGTIHNLATQASFNNHHKLWGACFKVPGGSPQKEPWIGMPQLILQGKYGRQAMYKETAAMEVNYNQELAGGV